MGDAVKAWEKKYANNATGLANNNNVLGGKGTVDTGVGTAMLKSNVLGQTNYKGGGVLDMNVARAELQQAIAQDQGNSKYNSDGSRRSGGGGSSRSGNGGSGMSGAFGDIQNAYQARSRAQQEAMKNELANLKTQADADRSGAYVNARVSAIGNNEQLASQGLAGGLYQNPTSGMSETSRIRQDTALGNNLNAVTMQQRQLENQARVEYATNNADNQLEMAKVIADLKMQQEQAGREQAQFNASQAQNQAQLNMSQGQFNAEQKASGADQYMQIVQALNSKKITRVQANVMLKQLGLSTI